MPAIKTGKKTEKYTTEFKVKAVEWSHQAHRRSLTGRRLASRYNQRIKFYGQQFATVQESSELFTDR